MQSIIITKREKISAHLYCMYDIKYAYVLYSQLYDLMVMSSKYQVFGIIHVHACHSSCDSNTVCCSCCSVVEERM